MLGQPVSLLVPRVVGCRLTGRRRPKRGLHRHRPDHHRTSAQTRRPRRHRRIHRPRPGRPLAAGPSDDRQHGRGIRRHHGLLPLGRGNHPLSGSNEPAAQRSKLRWSKSYAKASRALLWRDFAQRRPALSEDLVEFDRGSVEPCLAGPTRPEDRVPLATVPASFRAAYKRAAPAPAPTETERPLRDGDIAIAAISSCTNTSNPFQMIAAGLLAHNCRGAGLRAKPWVKTSISPGSRRRHRHAGTRRPAGRAGGATRNFQLRRRLRLHDLRRWRQPGRCRRPPDRRLAAAQNDLIVLGVISTNRNVRGGHGCTLPFAAPIWRLRRWSLRTPSPGSVLH